MGSELTHRKHSVQSAEELRRNFLVNIEICRLRIEIFEREDVQSSKVREKGNKLNLREKKKRKRKSGFGTEQERFMKGGGGAGRKEVELLQELKEVRRSKSDFVDCFFVLADLKIQDLRVAACLAVTGVLTIFSLFTILLQSARSAPCESVNSLSKFSMWHLMIPGIFSMETMRKCAEDVV
jgi:hypothetical protein